MDARPGTPSAFDLQPTLEGEHLRLRPLRAADEGALYACASDPLIWAMHPQPTRYQREVFTGFFDGAMASGGALIALDRATGEVLGSSRYYGLSVEESRVIIGYTFLARRCWGGVLNREMKRLMLGHAFRFVDAVRFEIGVDNLRSRRAIEKLGARLVDEEILDGKAHVVYQIDASGLRDV